jgi:hypothetical protein
VLRNSTLLQILLWLRNNPEKYVITEIDVYKIIFTLIKDWTRSRYSSQLFEGKRVSETIRSLYYRSEFLQMNFVALRWTDSMSIKMMSVIACCSKNDIWILLSLNSPSLVPLGYGIVYLWNAVKGLKRRSRLEQDFIWALQDHFLRKLENYIFFFDSKSITFDYPMDVNRITEFES